MVELAYEKHGNHHVVAQNPIQRGRVAIATCRWSKMVEETRRARACMSVKTKCKRSSLDKVYQLLCATMPALNSLLTRVRGDECTDAALHVVIMILHGPQPRKDEDDGQADGNAVL